MIEKFLSPQQLTLDPAEKWRALIHHANFLNSEFEIQLGLFREVYKDWNEVRLGPPPAWFPNPESVRQTNIHKFMESKKFSTYQEFHKWSIQNRSTFWENTIKMLNVRFSHPPSTTLDPSSTETDFKWLTDAKLNIAQSCFQAPPLKVAIVYQNENGSLQKMTYSELQALSQQVAACLQELGVKKGDAVAIDMPMTVESVGIYLGIVLAGCAVVSIADSFASDEIQTRLRISNAKLIFTQDFIFRGGKTLPLFAKVKEATNIPAIVLPCSSDQNLQLELRPQDKSWLQFRSLNSGSRFQVCECAADTPLNILFSSGTTGDPKAIPWTHLTPVKCASDAYFHHDVQENDILAWPTNLGWMMGPWLVFAALLNRATIALYYGAPLTREFGEFVQNAKVSMLGLVPSLVKVWRSTQCMRGLNWSSIKLFSSTGECSNAEDYLFLMSLAKYKPVVEYCGGTEIGGGFLTGTLVQNASPATFSTPALGIDIEILNENQKKSFGEGELFIVPPSIGLSNSLLNKNHEDVYFKNAPRNADGVLLRKHGDQMEYLPKGYVRALGRADDTMNLGGIKVSSAEIERALADVQGIFETAAVALNPPGGGPSLLKIFYVLKPGFSVAEEILVKEFQKSISFKLNPLFKVNSVQKMEQLPRTASNKVMRRLLR
jgi:acetyl-CoA synthetase